MEENICKLYRRVNIQNIFLKTHKLEQQKKKIIQFHFKIEYKKDCGKYLPIMIYYFSFFWSIDVYS